MKFISGKKLNMTQIWKDGRVIAVTPIAAGPCIVSQVKTKSKDGYEALQLAYGNRKLKNIKKPQQGHFKISGVKPSYVREFRLEKAADFKIGDIISVGTFTSGDIVNITGTSKGRGFQGVVKRHGFAGFRKTHGNKDQLRRSGSVGATGPAHVFKGTRMPGRMGSSRVTITNLEVVEVDEDKNLLLIKGAIPGYVNGYVMVQGPGKLEVNLIKKENKENKEKEKENKESVKDKDENEVKDNEVKDGVKKEIKDVEEKETEKEIKVEDQEKNIKEEVKEQEKEIKTKDAKSNADLVK